MQLKANRSYDEVAGRSTYRADPDIRSGQSRAGRGEAGQREGGRGAERGDAGQRESGRVAEVEASIYVIMSIPHICVVGPNSVIDMLMIRQVSADVAFDTLTALSCFRRVDPMYSFEIFQTSAVRDA